MRLKAKRYFLIISIAITLFINPTDTLGCTIFCLSDSTQSLMGNSEDYIEEGYMTLVKQNSPDYGMITFSFADKWVQGGVNEYGLAIDGTGAIKEMYMVSDSSLEDLPSKENIVEIILKRCKNTDQAIELCRKYNLPVLKYGHLMFADSSGNSAIVVLDKEGHTQFIRKECNYQLLTNFNPLNPEVGYYPCERFDTANSMLPDLAINEWKASEVLNAVRQEGCIKTHYGNVYDCRNKKFFFFRNLDYTQSLLFNIDELLKGNVFRVKVKSLPKLEQFTYPVESTVVETGNNSVSFRAVKGDYKLIMSKSENFENPIVIPIISGKIDEASLGLFFFIVLFLFIPWKKFKAASLALLLFVSISCDKDPDLFQPVEKYNVQITVNETGKWFWKIEGKTNSGYNITTKTLSFRIE